MFCCRFSHKPILNPLMKPYFAWAFHSWYIPWRRFGPKSHGFVSLQWGYTKLVIFKGKISWNSRILKWRYCTIFPYIGLKNGPYINGRYLQSIGSWVLAIENLGFRWILGTQFSDADGHQLVISTCHNSSPSHHRFQDSNLMTWMIWGYPPKGLEHLQLTPGSNGNPVELGLKI